MKKKLVLNTILSILLQIITIVCGLITPRLFLNKYGSEVNGLVQSITQFLGAITILELGIGQVIQSALYKPLASKDNHNLSCVVVAGNKFFRRIAYILVVYVSLLVVIYPFLIESNFDWMYTATLIVAISIGSFAQYYFGIIDNILLNADQRGYIQFFSQIIALAVNTALCAIFISIGFSIQIVKLTASVVFLLRPFAVRVYINKKYDIDRNVSYEDEPIKQKWNGIAQHIAGFILAGTDNIVLTLFSTLSNVSIYSAYYLVIHGVYQLHRSSMSGLHSLVGELWAKQDLNKLKRIFGAIELLIHFSTVFLFTCTGVLIVPFVRVYTAGITDADYIQPLFAVLIVLAYAFASIKTAYSLLVFASGHYKQTQRCHIISATLNLVISVSTVYLFGLVGVAIGTLVAMGYQMIWMAYYNSKKLLKWPFSSFLKQIFVDVITVLIAVWATSWIKLGAINYLGLVVMAVKVAPIVFLTVAIMIFIFYRKKTLYICKHIIRRK